MIQEANQFHLIWKDLANIYTFWTYRICNAYIYSICKDDEIFKLFYQTFPKKIVTKSTSNWWFVFYKSTFVSAQYVLIYKWLMLKFRTSQLPVYKVVYFRTICYLHQFKICECYDVFVTPRFVSSYMIFCLKIKCCLPVVGH